MSVVPIAARRPRQNGTIRPRPPLQSVPSDGASAAALGSTPAPAPRPNQAVASDRQLLGRASTSPRVGLFLTSGFAFLLVSELLLTLIPLLRVVAWGIGLVT